LTGRGRLLDKEILVQYMEACDLIRETEAEIQRLKKRRRAIEQCVVKGSMPEFPYTQKHFHVRGLSYSVISNPGALEAEERILEERRKNAEQIKLQVESWMATIPLRMQRIIRKRVFEQKTWEEVARSMGRQATADSVRMEFSRFMEK